MGAHPAHITRFGVALLLLAGMGSARAQDVDIRTIEEGDDRIVVEVTARWGAPMSQIIDSTGLSEFSSDAAQMLSRGLPLVSGTYELPSHALPQVSVLEAAYDEVDLPPADTGSVKEFSGPVAFAANLGRSRGRSLVNLVFRLVRYESGSVRRYTKVRAVMHLSPAPSKALTELSVQTNPHLQVTRSRLADGIIYKIPVVGEGIFRIDREFIAGLPGLNRSPDDIDPNHIQILGNGGEPLPALNSAPRPADLVENAVFRAGGGDGSFDAGDYVLFYGKGANGWRHTEAGWEHYVNPFSRENYYFIRIADEEGASVGNPSFPGFSDAQPVNEVIGRVFRDFDEFMWSKENGTGHTWVSNTVLRGGSRAVFEGVPLPGFAGGTVNYQIRTAIRSNPVATVVFDSGSQRLGQLRASRAVTSSETSAIAVAGIATFAQELGASGVLEVTMRFSPDAQGAPEAAIDWARAFYPRRLTASGDSLRFATPAQMAGRIELQLSGFSAEPHVWDVTDHGGIRRLGVQQSGNVYRVQLELPGGSRPREIFAFLPQNGRALNPATAQRVDNQNLHGITAYPDLIIVTPEAFRGVADDFAEYRREDGLNVEVAVVSRIYNEFSGGLQDMRAIRDYFRFLYDRSTDDSRRLRYALLLGDGHFNFRNLGGDSQQPELTNWILPYETEDSFDPDLSYTSDDYFGLLDPEEGIWAWPGIYYGVSTERVDIGVGRIPAQTLEEAAAVVAKIKHYENPETYGSWRTRYLFVADDGYNGIRPVLENRPDLHTQNSDVVAELIRQQEPAINLRKIYGISYTREFLNGWRLPGARRDLLAALNEGVLIMNYSGHGGEFSLAQEEIFTQSDALALRNLDRLPIVVTATCSFGWWDLAKEQSAAESMLLNPDGGAVALMTTVRLVYTDANINILNVGLNRALNTAMFIRDEQGRPRRIGDALREAKNTNAGLQGNNRKFNLLGDPTMRLGLPPSEATVDAINGQPVDGQPQMRALEEVKISGSIRTPSGDLNTSFDGQADVTVYDAARRVQIENRVAMPQDYYIVREDLIWRGTVPVVGGRFDATFVVPKDISYSNEAGRVSVYARYGSEHAIGYTENVVVGGTAANPPDDHEGPEIALYLNDTTFVSGGMTPRHPRLIVKLRDDSGINTVGAGVGHEMLLIVDGDDQNAVDISAGFESDPNSYRSGRVTYSFEEYPVELEDGPHTLTLRAWDVLNNSSTATLDFYVSSADGLVLKNVFNYPNPTSGNTRFIFEHNQPSGTPADVQIRIYTLSGRPIRTLDSDEALPSGVLTAGPVQVAWDGRDEDWNPIASGIYLYKVRVSIDSMDGGRHVAEHIERLAVIR